MAKKAPRGNQANPMRARIDVKGKVTKVGFLVRIRDLADELQITGSAKNIEDKWIEIYAKGRKDSIEEFVAKIKELNGIAKIASVNIFYENEEGYRIEKEPMAWDTFIIYRPDDREAWGERLDEGMSYLREMTKNLSCFKGQTREQFAYLGSKYHIISLSLIGGFIVLAILLFLIYQKLP